MPKRMRLPNGFGQISKLKSKRLRNPYRAMVTVGKTPEGRPICKLLKPQAYFPTYNDAYQALMEYNRNPYDFSTDAVFKDIYDKWFAEYHKDKSASTLKLINLAYKCCSDILNTDIREIKAHHIKTAIDKTKSPDVKRRVRYIFQEVLNYGIEYSILDYNIAKTFDPKISNEGKKIVSDHTAITVEELDTLWQNSSDPINRAILIQCYTGFRPDELCQLQKSDVHFEQGYIQGGMKTTAGKNRIVPIMEKIKDLVGDALAVPGPMLITTRLGKPMEYRNYYTAFKSVLPNHKPHDPRKTFVTMAKAADMDEYAIKRIVGHAIEDITENIYTDRDIEWLRSEIEKIDV